MNEDYIKGMKILLKISHEQGINIRKFEWIPLFCQKLSERGVCETFWKEVRIQNGVRFLEHYYKLWSFENLKMLVTALLTWDITSQGHKFWSRIYYSLLEDTTF